MRPMDKLQFMRENSGPSKTKGLEDNIISSFLTKDPKLALAIDGAFEAFENIKKNYPELFVLEEQTQIETLQEDIINYYPDDQRNPYVPIYACGPWIITCHGAVIHDSGGYGMLGLGHGPTHIIKTMSHNYVMANVMTASFEHYHFTKKLNNEIGKSRKQKPFSKYVFMNSGSEAMSVAFRIVDVNTKNLNPTNKKIMYLNLNGSFHGRTDQPARASDSSKSKYQSVLASFQNRTFAYSVEINNSKALEDAFDWAKINDVFFAAIVMEPVMGEGSPGKAINRNFYDTARKLSKQNQIPLIIDSIQAGFRAHGQLSICDYPGFEDCEAPDMESYSKAINAAQYPLSVLALNEFASSIYVKGIYGNTMTANPRALAVGSAVLDSITNETRQNIQTMGKYFLSQLQQLAAEFPDIILSAQGTGLLCAIEINEKLKVCGYNQLEEKLRVRGIGVIHGGKNALRFTPHFNITRDEIDLIISNLRSILS